MDSRFGFAEEGGMQTSFSSLLYCSYKGGISQVDMLRYGNESGDIKESVRDMSGM